MSVSSIHMHASSSSASYHEQPLHTHRRDSSFSILEESSKGGNENQGTTSNPSERVHIQYYTTIVKAFDSPNNALLTSELVEQSPTNHTLYTIENHTHTRTPHAYTHGDERKSKKYTYDVDPSVSVGVGHSEKHSNNSRRTSSGNNKNGNLVAEHSTENIVYQLIDNNQNVNHGDHIARRVDMEVPVKKSNVAPSDAYGYDGRKQSLDNGLNYRGGGGEQERYEEYTHIRGHRQISSATPPNGSCSQSHAHHVNASYRGQTQSQPHVHDVSGNIPLQVHDDHQYNKMQRALGTVKSRFHQSRRRTLPVKEVNRNTRYYAHTQPVTPDMLKPSQSYHHANAETDVDADASVNDMPRNVLPHLRTDSPSSNSSDNSNDAHPTAPGNHPQAESQTQRQNYSDYAYPQTHTHTLTPPQAQRQLSLQSQAHVQSKHYKSSSDGSTAAIQQFYQHHRQHQRAAHPDIQTSSAGAAPPVHGAVNSEARLKLRPRAISTDITSIRTQTHHDQKDRVNANVNAARRATLPPSSSNNNAFGASSSLYNSPSSMLQQSTSSSNTNFIDRRASFPPPQNNNAYSATSSPLTASASAAPAFNATATAGMAPSNNSSQSVSRTSSISSACSTQSPHAPALSGAISDATYLHLNSNMNPYQYHARSTTQPLVDTPQSARSSIPMSTSTPSSQLRLLKQRMRSGASTPYATVSPSMMHSGSGREFSHDTYGELFSPFSAPPSMTTQRTRRHSARAYQSPAYTPVVAHHHSQTQGQAFNINNPYSAHFSPSSATCSPMGAVSVLTQQFIGRTPSHNNNNHSNYTHSQVHHASITPHGSAMPSQIPSTTPPSSSLSGSFSSLPSARTISSGSGSTGNGKFQSLRSASDGNIPPIIAQYSYATSNFNDRNNNNPPPNQPANAIPSPHVQHHHQRRYAHPHLQSSPPHSQHPRSQSVDIPLSIPAIAAPPPSSRSRTACVGAYVNSPPSVTPLQRVSMAQNTTVPHSTSSSMSLAAQTPPRHLTYSQKRSISEGGPGISNRRHMRTASSLPLVDLSITHVSEGDERASISTDESTGDTILPPSLPVPAPIASFNPVEVAIAAKHMGSTSGSGIGMLNDNGIVNATNDDVSQAAISMVVNASKAAAVVAAVNAWKINEDDDGVVHGSSVEEIKMVEMVGSDMDETLIAPTLAQPTPKNFNKFNVKLHVDNNNFVSDDSDGDRFQVREAWNTNDSTPSRDPQMSIPPSMSLNLSIPSDADAEASGIQVRGGYYDELQPKRGTLMRASSVNTHQHPHLHAHGHPLHRHRHQESYDVSAAGILRLSGGYEINDRGIVTAPYAAHQQRSTHLRPPDYSQGIYDVMNSRASSSPLYDPPTPAPPLDRGNSSTPSQHAIPHGQDALPVGSIPIPVHPTQINKSSAYSSSAATFLCGAANPNASTSTSAHVSAPPLRPPPDPSWLQHRQPSNSSSASGSLGTEIQLDHLKRIGELGRGATGPVIKALYLPTLSIVALKTVRVDNKDERHQMEKELRAFHTVHSQHILSFIGACFNDGKLTMVLEYMNRGSLDQIVKKHGVLSENTIRQIAQQTLVGLQQLHQRHTVHRDIKPANILVDSMGRCKISDFGLLKQLDNTNAMCSTFVGTLLYLSPERVTGTNFSYPSDIWSLGLALMYCAQGYLPLPKDYWSIVTMLKEHEDSNQVDQRFTLDSTRFSPDFCDFVNQCLQKDPSKRPTAQQLLQHPFINPMKSSISKSLSTSTSTPNDTESEVEIATDNESDREEYNMGHVAPYASLSDTDADELDTLVDAVIEYYYPHILVFENNRDDQVRIRHIAEQLGCDALGVENVFKKKFQDYVITSPEGKLTRTPLKPKRSISLDTIDSDSDVKNT